MTILLFDPRCFFRGYFLKTALIGMTVLSMMFTHGQEPEAEPVQDLAYGDALFHFYSNNYFDAATRILVAQEQETLEHHEDDAQLLLAGLYLSYGRQDDAARIFNALLDNRSPSVRDRAWLYLAEIAWQRGNTERAIEALANVGDELDENFIARKQLLAARLFIDGQQFEQAINVLENWQGGEALSAYAKYNLGVALIRHGQAKRGSKYLAQIGKGSFKVNSGWRFFDRLRFWSAKNPSADKKANESQALRDKANLALGFSYLQQEQADRALEYLTRVSQQSAWSSKAQLGAGWAATELGQHKTALSHWETLSNRDRLDPAVQEALLAIPFARNGLGDDDLAMQEYQTAISHFEQEIEHLNKFEKSLDQGQFLRMLLDDDEHGTVGWFWRLNHMPDSEESRYLYHLVADHAFQEGLKNYRDLTFLKNNLLQWKNSVSVYQDMLEARHSRYQKRMQEQDGLDMRQPLTDLKKRVQEARDRLTQIEADNDSTALGSAQEQQHWQTLVAMEATLAQLPEAKTRSAQAKQRLLKGILLWDMDQKYSERLWSMKKQVRELELQLIKSKTLDASLEAARQTAPTQFDGFDQRIAAVTPKIDRMLIQVDQALNGHQSYLASLAGEQFDAHRLRLQAYLTEAQFALASTYDRAALSQDKP